MSAFGKSFTQAFTPSYQQGAAAYTEAQQQKMQAALQEQVRQKQREQAIIDEISQYGGNPVMNPDGSLNAPATMAKAVSMKSAFETQAGLNRNKAINAQNLEMKGSELGVPKEAAPNWQPGNGSILSPQAAQGVTADTFAQRVRGAEDQAKVKQAAAESEARAKATAPYESSYTGNTQFAINGKYIGTAVRNVKTGEYGIKNDDGSISPIPEGAEPITPTALQKNVPSYDSFRKVSTDLVDAERSLRQLDRYAKSVGGLNQGLAGLADGFTGIVKTLVGSKRLTQEELDRRMANGNIQGLLGSNRLAVVGGGVMTENDAVRIINYLGGDVGALQNKEQVMKALSQLYQDRYAQYENDLMFHNAAIQDYYGSKGYKAKDRVDYSPLFAEQEPGQPAPSSKFKIVEIK